MTQLRRVELVVAGIAVVATTVAYWLPIFQVGGFIYTMIDSHRGRGQFLVAAVLPVSLGVIVLVVDRRRLGLAAIAAAVMTTLAPVDHLTEAAWRWRNPEPFGSLFDLRFGIVVGLGPVLAGAVLFAALLRWLLSMATDRRRSRPTDVMLAVAVTGLLVAVAGDLAESSTVHLWQLPLWPQVGRWWKLIVTTGLVAVAIWRRRRESLAAGALVAVVAGASAAQEISAVARLEDDVSVSTTVTVVGFTVVAAALLTALVGSLRRR